MEVTVFEVERVFELKIMDGKTELRGRTRATVSVIFLDLDELPNREMLAAAMQQSLSRVKNLLRADRSPIHS